MLKIKANKSIELDGEQVDARVVNMKELFMGCLDSEVILEDGLKIGDLVHLLYEFKDFINEYFVDEYEAVRSLITMGRFFKPADYLNVYKILEEDEGYCYINSTSKIKFAEKEESKGKINVRDLTIKINETLNDEQNLLTNKIKVKFTFIDILKIIFDDFIYTLRNEAVLQ